MIRCHLMMSKLGLVMLQLNSYVGFDFQLIDIKKQKWLYYYGYYHLSTVIYAVKATDNDILSHSG
jgi:hypothetical protein